MKHLPLTKKDQEVIATLSIRIVNKLLAVPIEQVKRLSSEQKYIEIVKKLFALDEI